MTSKDIRRLEKALEEESENIFIEYDDDTEVMFPLTVLEEIEDYLGYPIEFMGISQLHSIYRVV